MKYKTRFLLFFVAMALFHLAANFAHPVTPTIIQELGLPDYMFGLMLAVMMIANFAPVSYTHLARRSPVGAARHTPGTRHSIAGALPAASVLPRPKETDP